MVQVLGFGLCLLAIGLAGCAQPMRAALQRPPDTAELGRQIMIMLPSAATVDLRPFEYNGAGYLSGHARNRALRTAAALASEHRIVVADDWAMPSLDLHCIVAGIVEGQDAARALAALNQDPRVAWAQPMGRFRTTASRPPGEGRDAAPGWNNLAALHRVATGRRVTIVQIDTGVDLRHPLLSGQWSGPRNFVDQRDFPAELHGTAVAGVAVARTDPNTGLVGVSPGARVIPLRACWEAGPEGAVCSTFTLAKSLQHALREAPQLINLSITGPSDRLLGKLIDRALDQGIVVVAAGGDPNGPGFPATHPRVLAVYGQVPPGSVVTMLQAPSQDILTTTPNETFAFLSGSSFSAAHATGLTALLLELAPSLSPAQVQTLLQSTAWDQGNGSRVARIDPCAALNAAAKRPALVCEPRRTGNGATP